MTDHPETSSSSSAIDLGVNPHLVRYGSIFLLIVGTFGNIVSFIIFSQSSLRKSSTFRYLALLSLMDLLVLYSGLLDLFLIIEYDGAFSLRNVNPITCRLHTFITYWSQHSSSWILSFISVDRAVATNCIQFARKFCTPRSAEYIVGIILIVVAILNCHELIFLHLQYSNDIDLVNAPDNWTTLSPLRSKQNPLFSNDLQMSTNELKQQQLQKRNLESAFLLFSICDSPQWNFLCPKEKRDLSSISTGHRLFFSSLTTSMFNVTSNLVSSESSPSLSTASSTSLSLPHCAALKGSVYEYFWDNVWEWIDVCSYALIPFTVMSIGTFLIVYRVYYQQRRVVRSRRAGRSNQIGSNSPNKAKSLFYLLFTLNLLYFILVSPVVFATSILFRDQKAEVSYPNFKSIIYLMQYCNHSLNFIFYGITSPPYRQTLYGWFESLMPYLPNCCQQRIRRHSKTVQNRSTRGNSSRPKQLQVSLRNNREGLTTHTATVVVENETRDNLNEWTVTFLKK